MTTARRIPTTRLAIALLLAGPARAQSPLVYELTRGTAGTVRVEERSGPAALGADLPRLKEPRAALRHWVEESAGAVAGYYGRLPVERLTVTIRTGGAGKIDGGVTFGGPRGARIDVNAGEDLTAADLDEDWVLTHEVVHTALPDLPGGAGWLGEGLATYVEPIARVRRGRLPPDEVWAWLTWGLPQGLPRQGEAGLDGTRSWARTYWGGALFCFLADIELRERTRNRVSLREALVGILDAGGSVNARWSLEQVLAAADRATGLTVLSDLHARMGPRSMTPDLPALFRRLGVTVRERKASYEDGAPLVAIRRSLPTGATDPVAR